MGCLAAKSDLSAEQILGGPVKKSELSYSEDSDKNLEELFVMPKSKNANNTNTVNTTSNGSTTPYTGNSGNLASDGTKSYTVPVPSSTDNSNANKANGEVPISKNVTSESTLQKNVTLQNPVVQEINAAPPTRVIEPISSSVFIKPNLKHKKKAIEKTGDFALDYVSEMNECRSDPAGYAIKIELFMKFIRDVPDKGGVFELEGHPKVALTKGLSAFREFSEKLKYIPPMQKLELRPELSVPISDNPKYWSDKQTISEAVHSRKSALKDSGKYYNFNFHFDIGSVNSEYSFILQLVDDTPFKGTRQRNILNPAFKYIGISTKKIKNKNCSYFFFSG